METEELRRELLEDSCAGAFSGMPAMILDEDLIRKGDRAGLKKIAEEHGRKDL